jgi:hypothetical protein
MAQHAFAPSVSLSLRPGSGQNHAWRVGSPYSFRNHDSQKQMSAYNQRNHHLRLDLFVLQNPEDQHDIPLTVHNRCQILLFS